MDLMSATQLLGNLGEFVGAIAVVVTLGYLTVQIRQNTAGTNSNNNGAYFRSITASYDSLFEFLGRLPPDEARPLSDRLFPPAL